MFRIILPLIVTVLLSGCMADSVGKKYSNYGSTSERTEVTDLFSTNTAVKYMSYEYLKSEMEKNAKVKMYTPEEMKVQFSAIPANGIVVVSISAPTVKSVNTKWWSAFITDESGKVVQRYQPEWSVGTYDIVNGSTFWHNSFSFELAVPPGQTFNVHVNTGVHPDQRWSYKIYPNQEIK
ncbi:hypothetical protein ELQ32_01355 [Limnobaculum zhutongyuii]|nr:hypothetical protein [Limnobaculum zhutongyuii]TQS91004.1 hypothetical protein ELQ32_01355 [Limnobaculum zhutongyuii]